MDTETKMPVAISFHDMVLCADKKELKRFPPVKLSLPMGMPVSATYKSWVLLDQHPLAHPYFWMRSGNNTSLQGAVVLSKHVVPDYAPVISQEDIDFLEIDEASDAEILLSVFFGENGLQTVNLKTPVIINPRTLRGKLVTPLNSDEFSEQHIIVAPTVAKPAKYWTCKERNKVQLRLDGKVRACCVLADVFWPAEDAFRLKRELNENISKGDFGVCKGCVYLRETTEKPNPVPVMIDILTNSFCSVRCWYCSYTKVGGMADTPADFKLDKCGVEQHVVNTEDIPAFVRNFSKLSGGTLQSISLSGGDSAYHPQFREICKTTYEVGAQLIYLSAGILSPDTEQFCIDEIRSGRMFMSISPDAAKAETWSKIKLRNGKLWNQLVSFVSRAATGNPHKVIVKRIVNPDNTGEATEFIQFWYSQGVRQFALCALFGNKGKQLTREQCDQEIAETKKAVAELEAKHNQKLYLEVIAF